MCREDHTELFQLQILIRASSSAESRQLLDFLQFVFKSHSPRQSESILRMFLQRVRSARLIIDCKLGLTSLHDIVVRQVFCIFVWSAALAKSGPLDFPSEKILSFIFCPRKGLRAHVSKMVYLFSNSLFLCYHKPNMIFGQTTSVNSDRKCKFQRFCPARSDCNNVAHGILSCYKLQDVFS